MVGLSWKTKQHVVLAMADEFIERILRNAGR